LRALPSNGSILHIILVHTCLTRTEKGCTQLVKILMLLKIMSVRFRTEGSDTV
jgi:hypothetical protein